MGALSSALANAACMRRSSVRAASLTRRTDASSSAPSVLTLSQAAEDVAIASRAGEKVDDARERDDGPGAHYTALATSRVRAPNASVTRSPSDTRRSSASAQMAEYTSGRR